MADRGFQGFPGLPRTSESVFSSNFCIYFYQSVLVYIFFQTNMFQWFCSIAPLQKGIHGNWDPPRSHQWLHLDCCYKFSCHLLLRYKDFVMCSEEVTISTMWKGELINQVNFQSIPIIPSLKRFTFIDSLSFASRSMNIHLF